MLFLKRCSDQSDAIKEQLVTERVAEGKSWQAAENNADVRYHYRDTFYVPDEARWQWINDHSRDGHKAVGDMLSRALGALKEENARR